MAKPESYAYGMTDMQPHLHGAFGSDPFGRGAERFARLFGTPTFLIAQTIVVIIWIALNSAALAFEWDPYPFILLNLAFSTQAAYAAPLLLLAQTRQADRDHALADADEHHRNAMEERLQRVLDENTRLTRDLHSRLLS